MSISLPLAVDLASTYPVVNGNYQYPGDIDGPLRFKSITGFLNRSCPRRCDFCGIADNSRKAMSIPQWIEALTILKAEFGVEFLLFLGTEPLLFREGLIDLIDWFTKNHSFYGFYSTSPEPLFSVYKQKLVDAGLNNWSSGIDLIPGMTGEKMSRITEKKSRESLAGLQWMADRGVQTHTLTTVHKQNLKDLVSIMTWCQDNIKGCQSSMNFIEWRKDVRFDFFSYPHEMPDMMWDGTPEEREQIKAVMRNVKALSRTPGRIIQIVDKYLDDAHLHYDKLNSHCDWSVGPAIDADGTIRICGYSRDDVVGEFHVLDLGKRDVKEKFTREWRKAVGRCSGCHWIWPDMLRSDTRILDPKSGIHQERWKEADELQRQAYNAANKGFRLGPMSPPELPGPNPVS